MTGKKKVKDSPPETPAGCPVPANQQPCVVCGLSFEPSPKHLEKNGSVCKACVRTQKTKRRERAALRRKAAMDKIERQALDLYTKVAASGGSNIPHSAEVLERIFQYFGGVAGFSAMLVKQYYDSPPGGSARNRMLETVVRLVTKNVEAGGAKRPLSLWTEEELETELETRFSQALNTYRGITVDATPKLESHTEEIQAAQAASDPDSEDSRTDGVPKGRDQNSPVRNSRKKAGGPPAV